MWAVSLKYYIYINKTSLKFVIEIKKNKKVENNVNF